MTKNMAVGPHFESVFSIRAPSRDEHSSPKKKTDPEGSKESDWRYARLMPGAKMEIPDRIDAALDAKKEILADLEVHLC